MLSEGARFALRLCCGSADLRRRREWPRGSRRRGDRGDQDRRARRCRSAVRSRLADAPRSAGGTGAMRILAAIVTYNRMALLERCIDHVRAQTRSPDRLIVINNSSTDGTAEMLEAKGVDYLTQPNLGSAGG